MGHAGASMNGSIRVAIVFEAKDFFQVGHGYPFSCHVCLLGRRQIVTLGQPTMGKTERGLTRPDNPGMGVRIGPENVVK
jgi:hypothetical protein